MKDQKEIFNSILHQMRESIGDVAYALAFSSIEMVAIDKDLLTIGVPAEMFKATIEKKHFSILKTIVKKEAKINDVKIIVSNQKSASDFITPSTTTTTKKSTSNTAKTSNQQEDRLQPGFTFANFVVGPSNTFPHSVAQAISNNPGQAHNPCLIYGNVGLGKTHLMQAIGNQIKQNNPSQKVLYYDSETFLNEFVRAIEVNKIREFKNRIRSADVLLIDDIQFFSGKPSLQEEFYHSFNSLLAEYKQMVFTCDRQIHKIPDLEERLQSRFRSNMIVDLQPPEPEVARGIINRVLKEKKITTIEEEVISFIVERMRSNIRDMIGVINRITGYQEMTGTTVGLSVIRQWHAEYIPHTNTNQRITTDNIVAVVANYYNVSVSNIKSQKRQRDLVKVRRITIYLLRELTKLSFTEIGKIVNLSHVAATKAYSRAEEEMSLEIELMDQIEDLKFSIREKQDNS